MNQRQFFEHVLRTLDELGVPYMITGSVGAILYGEPRLTNDMDLVVELSGESVDSLAAAFVPPDECFPPLEVVGCEIAARRQFNLIHVASGSKVDFIVRKDTDFARCEFGRRRRVVFSEALDAASATPRTSSWRSSDPTLQGAAKSTSRTSGVS